MRERLNRLARVLGPLAVTALLLILLSRVSDLRDALRQLAGMQPVYFAGAVLVMMLGIAIATLRYRRILRSLHPGLDAPFCQLLQLNFLTLFGAHFMPFGAMADAMRAVISRVILGIPTGYAIEAVVTDRGLAAMGFAVTGLLLLPIQIVAGWPFALISAQGVTFAGILALIGMGGLASRYLPPVLEAVVIAVKRFFGHTTTAVNAFWHFSMAVASTSIFAGMLVLLARGLDLHLSVWVAITTASALYISQIIPIFYAGFGSREVTMVAIFVPAGVMPASDAIALAISIGVCNLVASLPGAVFAFRLYSQIPDKKGRRTHQI